MATFGVDVGVVVAADAPVADEVVAVLEIVLQVTAVGRPVTPAFPQNFAASLVAFSWSALSQTPARQQAMLSRKDSFRQMHLISMSSHLPIFEPLVAAVTHPSCSAEEIN